MYYDYYNNDNIISSVCITLMKTLKLGGNDFFNVLKSHLTVGKTQTEALLPINEIALCSA